MRNISVLVGSLVIFASCTTMKGTPVKSESLPVAKSGSPRFIEDIRINPAGSSTTVENPSFTLKRNAIAKNTGTSSIEGLNALQFKYGILINSPVESLSNEKLLLFLEDWYGTPYRYGGSSKTGIDCSAFTNFLMTDVYGVQIPRTSRDQFQVCKQIDREELREGDLVFFKNRGRISHVGVYLGNNKFAHASTSSGVMISDLAENYFSRRYAGSGRVL